MPTEYKEFTLSSDQNYFATPSSTLFTLISASLTVQNSSSIIQQYSLFNLFLSTLNFIDSSISQIDILEPVIRVTSSSLNMTNTNISRITDIDNYDFMLITLDSSLTINSLVFEDSTSNLFNSRNTKIYIDDLMIRNTFSFTNFIKILSSDEAIINQYQSSNTNSNIDEQILITDSSNVKIMNLEVHDTAEVIINTMNSNVTSLSDIQIHS